MVSIFNFISVYSGFLLSGINALLFYFFLFEAAPRSFARLVAFPFLHFQSLLSIREHPIIIPIVFCYFIFVGGIASLIAPSQPYVYFVWWGLILMCELFMPTAYVLKLRRILPILIFIVIFLIFISYGIIMTIQIKEYKVMNAVDFISKIYVFAFSLFVMIYIIIKDRFARDFKAFFVFFGLILYSFLHIISTIALEWDFLGSLDFAFWATRITMLFWIASIPWIRHLQSKLT